MTLPYNHKLKKQWIDKKGVKQAGPYPCYRRLFGKRCLLSTKSWDENHKCLPPHSDHTEAFTKDGKTKFIVSQPYGLTKKQLKEISAFCDETNLDFYTESYSWYFPNNTTCIVFYKESEGESEG